VVFMTGYARNAIVHNGMLDPDADLITKPFTLAQLAAKLEEALSAGKAPPASRFSGPELAETAQGLENRAG
jgi:FixJ family two-component response regulator